MDLGFINYRISRWQLSCYNINLYNNWIQEIDNLIYYQIPIYPNQIEWYYYLKWMIPIWNQWITDEFNIIMLNLEKKKYKSCLMTPFKSKRLKRVSFHPSVL